MQAILDEERRTGSTLPVESLITLHQLRHERRVSPLTVARAIQRDETSARSILERLVETGMVEAHGGRSGREYTFSAALYRQLGQAQDYVRQTAFTAIQQEQMVKNYIEAHGQITRRETMTLCRISEDQARRLLDRMVKSGTLRRIGRSVATVYVRNNATPG